MLGRERFADFKGVDLVNPHSRRLALEFLDMFRLGLDGGMYAVIPQIQEEGLSIVTLDQRDGFIRQPVGEIFAIGTVFETGDIVRAEIAVFGMPPETATAVDIEAVVLRVGGFAAQMPFANMPGVVTAFFQCGCQADLFQRQVIDIGGIDQACFTRMGAFRQIDPSRRKTPPIKTR